MMMPVSEASLEKVAHSFPQAFANKDIDQIISYFAEDVIAMYPTSPLPINGRAANREVWENYYQRRDTHPFTTDTVVVAASNDVGYSFGLWASAEIEEPGAAAGRYTAIWTRKKQQWEIVVLSGHIHEDIHPFAFQSRLS